MAKHEAPDEFDGLSGRPQLVEVTLLADPDAREPNRGIGSAHTRRLTRAILALALAAGLAALVVGSVAGRRDRGAPRLPLPAAARGAPRLPLPAAAHDPGPTGVAAAYGYPLRCLSVTIAPGNHSYARADFDHASPCGRYDGNVTAIFHRVDRAWRPVLDATGYSCPVASLSAAVQTELDVCPQAAPRRHKPRALDHALLGRFRWQLYDREKPT